MYNRFNILLYNELISDDSSSKILSKFLSLVTNFSIKIYEYLKSKGGII